MGDAVGAPVGASVLGVVVSVVVSVLVRVVVADVEVVVGSGTGQAPHANGHRATMVPWSMPHMPMEQAVTTA